MTGDIHRDRRLADDPHLIGAGRAPHPALTGDAAVWIRRKTEPRVLAAAIRPLDVT